MAKGGRPAFRPTIEQRETVEQMTSCGEPLATIARALGIDDATLRKHFAEELANGIASKRKEVVAALFKAMREGSAPATRRLEEMTREAALAAGFMCQAPRSGMSDGPAPPRLGKKDAAAAEAERIASSGGKYAPPAPPKLVVNNGS